MLAASPRAAAEMVLDSKVAVVAGGPSVGRTTLLDTILRVLSAKGARLILAAPIGCAAKRIAQEAGLEARTAL